MCAVSLIKKPKVDTRELSEEFSTEFTLDELKKLHRELTASNGPARRAEAAESLAKILSDTGLPRVFKKLDKIEKLAVSEALFDDGFNPAKFKEKYKEAPDLGARTSYRPVHLMLRLFLRAGAKGRYVVRKPLRKRLADFVEQPLAPPSKKKEVLTLKVQPNLRIRLTKGQLSVTQTLLLNSFGTIVSDGVWELSKVKSLESCEQGHKIGELRTLLEAASDERELPEPVVKFLDQIEERARAIEFVGHAHLFYCRNGIVALEIASHALTKSFCEIAGTNHLVVKTCYLEKFRKAIKVIGFGAVFDEEE